MSGHSGNPNVWRACLISALLLIFALPVAGAQYWFQSGAQGSLQSEFNSGASISIQTITPQPVASGSLGYWIGETLSNGAFIQVGYDIPNQTGYYPTDCTPSGCTGRIELHSGVASWFWEYFLPNSTGSEFMGALGSDGSAGINGTFHTYSFKASGNMWYAYFDGTQIGQVNLGASTSGSHVPLGIAEYAQTDTNNNYMPTVKFTNMSFYDGLQYKIMPEGQALINYGVGSQHGLPNIYGVQEYDNLINYFEVGSGIPVQPQIRLWSLGYSLKVFSQYGGISGTTNYTPYSTIRISAPPAINLTDTERVRFGGWVGIGAGAYTGPDINASVTMNQNVTERATWVTQYYVNATSQYGQASGAGWHDANTTARISIDANSISAGIGRRAIFSRWSDGETNTSISVYVNAPLAISPEWAYQYLVNATSPYGKVSGSGWYDANTPVRISVSNTTVDLGNGARAQFVNWSNGAASSTIYANVTAPILVSARFDKEYLVGIKFENAYGEPIAVSSIGLDGSGYNGTSAFIDPSLRINKVNYAYYKGTNMTVNYSLSGISSKTNPVVVLPVYNITISAKGELGFPINATANLTFKNGTTSTFYTGPSGVLVIHNVPYGYTTGTLNYFALSQPINASYGGIVEDTFITPVAALAVLAALGIVFLIEREYFKRQERSRRRTKR